MQKRARHPQKFMSSSQQKSVPRAVIEHMVREQVYQEMGIDLPAQAKAPKGFVVNISARHCHLTQEAVEALFGPGHELTPNKWLYQEGAYAAKESVTLIGPRSRVISNLRILGPCRDLTRSSLHLPMPSPLALIFPSACLVMLQEHRAACSWDLMDTLKWTKA